MAIIRKNAFTHRCSNFSSRYPDHEANDLLREAEGLIADMESEIEELRAALTPPQGYVPAIAVLATATRLRRLASAASPLGRKAYIKAAEDIELTVSAARPEVIP